MNLTVSFNLNLPFAAASGSQAAEEEEEDYDSEADEDFADESQEDESLGDFDTDIEAEEVGDLEADLEDMVTSTRKKSMTPKKAGPKKDTDTVDGLSGHMRQMKVSTVKHVSFDWRFPMSMYSVMEDNENKIYIELLKGVQLPPEFIQHAKVLPGGMQFSLLVGVPRWMYEESYMKAHMGMGYNITSAVFHAFGRYVIQPIRKLFPGTSACIEGTPQIVDLDEECVEGPVPYHFGNARTKGTEHINNSRQFQSTMTFQLTAVKKKALKVDKPTILNFGYINSSDDSEEERNMSNDEEEY